MSGGGQGRDRPQSVAGGAVTRDAESAGLSLLESSPKRGPASEGIEHVCYRVQFIWLVTFFVLVIERKESFVGLLPRPLPALYALAHNSKEALSHTYRRRRTVMKGFVIDF